MSGTVWIRMFDIIKIEIFPQIYPLIQHISFQNPTYLTFFANFDKLLLKLTWKCYKNRTDKTVLKKKNQVGGHTIPDRKTGSKTAVFMSVVLA